MEQSARTSGRRSVGMHVGRRFGDVLVCLEADEELTWFFNQAGEQIEQPSIQGAVPDGLSPCSLEAVEARADALHAGFKIWGRMQNIGAREARVLEALYTELTWPWVLTRRLGHLVGVVEWLPGVRADYLGARMHGRTTAASATEWLVEQVEQSSNEISAWRGVAVRACERALSAYQRARGKGPSVVPQEDR